MNLNGLVQGNPLPKDNKLLPLNLFCDSEGVLRVGGRLSRNTRLSYDQKHPLLLPKSHEFTRKISSSSYTQKVSNLLQDESDIISIDGGFLPPIRFQRIRPFESTGLEFAGPSTTKCAHKRTALRRFIARRSCPSKLISDNGSNFKGASSHLRKLVELCLQEVQNFLSLKEIEWYFIPPYTPHFGGLWRLVLTQDLSQSSLQISPSDFNALTPAHFLVGGPIHQFPESSQPSRSKWWRTKPNLQLGDMVIVEKEQTAPLNWTLGQINKLFFGPDQKVRAVSVNTKYGQLTRNENNIYLLPNSEECEL
ncbi:uncharacterized protein TNCV_1373601 [Trichonephila clavipes]|uniref:DUF5641 domain-containing protein n=1 Tax=Trichonephila clavipes TaxID=2585209 RepID=A0A8X7BLI5_TRICX|nr:uncharacterized protein TNCV_1373601 [Trichonephila clavipes]